MPKKSIRFSCKAILTTFVICPLCSIELAIFEKKKMLKPVIKVRIGKIFFFIGEPFVFAKEDGIIIIFLFKSNLFLKLILFLKFIKSIHYFLIIFYV